MPTVAEKSQEVRSRIVAAAAELFAEHGFAGASVDEIARRADVNKAMLYYHIGDKAELFATVLEGYLERVRAALEGVEAETPDPAERIRKAQAAIFAIFQRDPTVPRIVIREMATGGDQIPDRALAKVGEIVGFTFRTVGEGRESGAFGDVNPFLVHAMLVGTSALVVNSTKLRARLARATGLPLSPAVGPAEIAGALGDVILHGISRPRKAGGKK
jgi:TetR/AcrR family transcriptional regulator